MEENKKMVDYMSAQDMLDIFIKTRPTLFDHIYKECNAIYENRALAEESDKDYLYFANEEFNIAKAIIYDYGTRANKIGEIIVAGTK